MNWKLRSLYLDRFCDAYMCRHPYVPAGWWREYVCDEWVVRLKETKVYDAFRAAQAASEPPHGTQHR